MLRAGDELGHTQRGNNNAYCQDNETSWLDWQPPTADDPAFLRFMQRAIGLRKEHRAFASDQFYTGRQGDSGLRDIAWLSPPGREMNDGDWQDQSNVFACAFHDAPRYLLLLNAGAEPIRFTLPESEGGPWRVLLDTAFADGDSDAVFNPGAATDLDGHRLMLLMDMSA